MKESSLRNRVFQHILFYVEKYVDKLNLENSGFVVRGVVMIKLSYPVNHSSGLIFWREGDLRGFVIPKDVKVPNLSSILSVVAMKVRVMIMLSPFPL